MEIKPKKFYLNKVFILYGIIIILAGLVAYNFYGKIMASFQTKYFNAGGQFIIKDLIGKSENCQKVKLQTGEEFIRVSCFKTLKTAEPTPTQTNPFENETPQANE